MLVPVMNAAGQLQTVSFQGQDAITDRSGTIAGVASQAVAPANPVRGGFLVQNRSQTGNPMVISEIGNDATFVGSFLLQPGAFFPPPGYPIPVGVINIAGTVGDAYAAREW